MSSPVHFASFETPPQPQQEVDDAVAAIIGGDGEEEGGDHFLTSSVHRHHDLQLIDSVGPIGAHEPDAALFAQDGDEDDEEAMVTSDTSLPLVASPASPPSGLGDMEQKGRGDPLLGWPRSPDVMLPIRSESPGEDVEDRLRMTPSDFSTLPLSSLTPVNNHHDFRPHQSLIKEESEHIKSNSCSFEMPLRCHEQIKQGSVSFGGPDPMKSDSMTFTSSESLKTDPMATFMSPDNLKTDPASFISRDNGKPDPPSFMSTDADIKVDPTSFMSPDSLQQDPPPAYLPADRIKRDPATFVSQDLKGDPSSFMSPDGLKPGNLVGAGPDGVPILVAMTTDGQLVMAGNGPGVAPHPQPPGGQHQPVAPAVPQTGVASPGEALIQAASETLTCVPAEDPDSAFSDPSSLEGSGGFRRRRSEDQPELSPRPKKMSIDILSQAASDSGITDLLNSPGADDVYYDEGIIDEGLLDGAGFPGAPHMGMGYSVDSHVIQTAGAPVLAHNLGAGHTSPVLEYATVDGPITAIDPNMIQSRPEVTSKPHVARHTSSTPATPTHVTDLSNNNPLCAAMGPPSSKLQRRKRCGQCEPCLVKANCESCKNCLNRKVLKQTCMKRKCVMLKEKPKRNAEQREYIREVSPQSRLSPPIPQPPSPVAQPASPYSYPAPPPALSPTNGPSAPPRYLPPHRPPPAYTQQSSQLHMTLPEEAPLMVATTAWQQHPAQQQVVTAHTAHQQHPGALQLHMSTAQPQLTTHQSHMSNPRLQPGTHQQQPGTQQQQMSPVKQALLSPTSKAPPPPPPPPGPPIAGLVVASVPHPLPPGPPLQGQPHPACVTSAPAVVVSSQRMPIMLPQPVNGVVASRPPLQHPGSRPPPHTTAWIHHGYPTPGAGGAELHHHLPHSPHSPATSTKPVRSSPSPTRQQPPQVIGAPPGATLVQGPNGQLYMMPPPPHLQISGGRPPLIHNGVPPPPHMMIGGHMLPPHPGQSAPPPPPAYEQPKHQAQV